jgi:Ca2+-transporting ATPase
LLQEKDRLITAIRSGKVFELSIYDVVAGDLLHLESGDLVPADGILISGHNVRCDESSVTGESDQRKKTPGDQITKRMQAGASVDKLDPFIVSGSKVLEGVGTYMVTAVGTHSTYGRTMVSLVDENEPTPLQQKLTVVADQIAVAGIAVAALLFVVLTLKFIIQLPDNMDSPAEKGRAFLRIVIVSITVVVIAVPEGLPLAVTLALAIAVTKMLKDNNLVRHLSACEAMGSATTVCSDKTGTLTTNMMTVVAGTVGTRCQFGGNPVPGRYRDDEGENDPVASTISDVSANEFISLLSAQMKFILSQSIVINSTAFEGEEDGKSTFIGSRTEIALLSFAKERLGIRPVGEERADAQVVQIIPFDSGKKCMVSVVDLGGITRMYVKGAPEVLLERCSRVVRDASDPTVNTGPLSDDQNLLTHVIQVYSNRSLRMIGFAHRDFPCSPPPDAATLENDPTQVIFEDLMRDMTFLGIFGIQDPLRPGVQVAVSKCRNAGVSVRMVTGDNLGTAKAIAIECGILDPNGLALDGPTFRKLSKSEVYRVLSRLQVLARSNPEDKRVLVKRLKELGEVVAVTGDGTNDGPAIKAADVGFSMGISGTDIAREASSIILMDDNFSSVVKAIEWGRTVHDAIKKFLQVSSLLDWVSASLTSSKVSTHSQYYRRRTHLCFCNNKRPRRIDPDSSAIALGESPYGHLCSHGSRD